MKSHNKKAHVHLGLAPFNGVGRPVAYLACKLFLARLYTGFDIKNGGEKEHTSKRGVRESI